MPCASHLADTPWSRARAPHADLAAWPVSDRDGLSLLHTPRASGPGREEDHPGDGRWHHRSWLDRPGIVVVSCATVALDTTHEARASLTCTQRLSGNMTWQKS